MDITKVKRREGDLQLHSKLQSSLRWREQGSPYLVKKVMDKKSSMRLNDGRYPINLMVI